MAENISTEQVVDAPPVLPSQEINLAEMMKMQGIASATPAAPKPAAAAPAALATPAPAIVTPAQRIPTNLPQPLNQPAKVEPPVAATPAAPIEPATPAAPAFTFDQFKEKFGYKTPEEVLADIANLREYKEKTPATPALKFENEDSKKLFDLFQGGKTKEVAAYLAKQHQIDEILAVNVDKSNAADIVKFGMGLRYKDLSPVEIDYKFKKMFGTPAKPVQSADQDDDDFKREVAKWEDKVNDLQMDLMIEAKTARPEIEAAKAKLVMPTIESPVDQDYLNYKKQVETDNALNAQTAAAYASYTPAQFETKINFNDEANKIAFDFSFVPSAESFAETNAMVTDMKKFYAKFVNPDGTPDRVKFFRTIHNAINQDAMLVEAMKQAKNATLKSMLPDNSTGGLVRQLTQLAPGEESELDKNMRLAGVRKG